VIQLAAAKALLGRVPWRLVGGIAAGLALALLLWRVTVWKGSHEALPLVQQELELERACGEGSECYARQQALQEAAGHATVIAVQGYEAELAAVRARPARVVRLCPAAGSGDVRGAGPAAGTDGTAASAGLVSGPAGPDLGAELYGLARDADEVVAKCRALQGWNRALTAGK
jgi:hypothetical protein